MIAIIGAVLATLLQITVGVLFAAVLSDWRREVSRGFLVMTVLTALVGGALTFGMSGLARLEGLERGLHALLLVPLVTYAALLATRRRALRLAIGLLGVAVGMSALILAATGRPSAVLGPWLTALAFALSALALGAGISGLLLGHWYLTTPNLTSRPLRFFCDLLLASLVPLSMLALWFLAADSAVSGLAGLQGLALWVGASMITLFPLAVTLAARACCVDGPGRGRSIQAATGLLYLVAAAVLAGGLAGNAVLLGA